MIEVVLLARLYIIPGRSDRSGMISSYAALDTMLQDWSAMLRPRHTRGAQVVQIGPAGAVKSTVWRLEIPAGSAGHYRLAQLDDYSGRPRWKFPWRAPFRLALRARASASEIPGTWGFGLWNNPFG